MGILLLIEHCKKRQYKKERKQRINSLKNLLRDTFLFDDLSCYMQLIYNNVFTFDMYEGGTH